MSARTTRTLNPLPFQDLEPHRFEDLVRQLAYEFREWHSLEAVGRSGADEGTDIRGVERPSLPLPEERDDTGTDGDGHDANLPREVGPERLWIFQCKREKTMSPAGVKKAIAKSLETGPAPHGFVLATSSDLSRKARDVFRVEMVRRGVAEFFVWARGELEDMLFQAQNDRLLFAYFGISLQPRRRSFATTLRSEIALKKQLKKLLEGEEGVRGRGILLRDPTDDRYPNRPQDPRDRLARWLLRQALHLRHPGHLAVLDGIHPAWIAPDGRGWDYVRDCNVAARHVLLPHNAWSRDEDGTDDEDPRGAIAFWNEYVPEKDQAWLHVHRLVPLARIVAVDPIGDGYFPCPHVLLEFDRELGPYREGAWVSFQPPYGRGHVPIRPEEAERTTLFPTELPSALYPPLPQFDHGAVVHGSSFSEAGSTRLHKVIDSLAERREAVSAARANPRERDQEPDKLKQFTDWRSSIALPVLKRFEQELRDAGHDARIAVHSIGGNRPSRESVELRVRLDAGGSAGNPDYRSEGHLRFEAESYGPEVTIEARPSEDPKRGYQIANPPSLAELTRATIEAYVLGMLERLAAGEI